jgi:hypothetical protein
MTCDGRDFADPTFRCLAPSCVDATGMATPLSKATKHDSAVDADTLRRAFNDQVSMSLLYFLLISSFLLLFVCER